MRFYTLSRATAVYGQKRNFLPQMNSNLIYVRNYKIERGINTARFNLKYSSNLLHFLYSSEMQAYLSKLASYLHIAVLLSIPSDGLVIRDESQLQALSGAGLYKSDFGNVTNSIDNAYVVSMRLIIVHG